MIRYWAALAAATLALGAPAAAQTVTSANPESVAAVLRAKGYQAEMFKDGSGDPAIRSAAGGSKFTVLFYGCTNNRGCTTVQFYAGYKSNGSVAIARMNEWNKTKRFARAYIDNEGDPVLEMDVDLDEGGMSRALFGDYLDVWSALIGEYRTFVNK